MGQKKITSAESAVHCQMRPAFGLRPNHIPHVPRALPWAGMNQALGLKAVASKAGYKPTLRGYFVFFNRE
jgi:hypothetical protein